MPRTWRLRSRRDLHRRRGGAAAPQRRDAVPRTHPGRRRPRHLSAGRARRPWRPAPRATSSPTRRAAMPNFTAVSRPGLPRPGRQRDQRQRRAVRAAAEPDHAPPADPRGRRRSATRGKVYDGWETRRRREPGYDWAIVRLGVPGIVHGVVVDTAFFKGNYPPLHLGRGDLGRGLSRGRGARDGALDHPGGEDRHARATRENYYEVDDPKRWTHVRLNIFPDGGVARFRVHGEVVVDPRFLTTTVDLLAQENGGRLLDTSDAFYSTPANLILSNRARIMGEGWENARRRGAGQRLGGVQARRPGRADDGRGRHLLLHRQRPRARCGSASPTRRQGSLEDDEQSGGTWCPRRRSLVDTRHRFLVDERRTATHLRLDVYPDGGLTRLRCFGELPEEVRKDLYERFFEVLPEEHQHYIEATRRPPRPLTSAEPSGAG